jgi:nitrilase
MSTGKRLAKYTAAVVQAAPVFLDLEATVDKAVLLIREAGRRGAKLIAFPETWIPSYPVWIFGAAGWGDPAAGRVYAQLHRNSLMIGGEPLKRLCAAAETAGAFVVMGAHEKLSDDAGSLYNSQFFISETGQLLGVHRKLMPTYTERNIWAYGDGSTLGVYESSVGRVGGLICWEHWMPLACFAMHSKHEHVHIAAWPEVPEAHQLASRHYAFQGKCYVLCVGSYLTYDHIPESFELRAAIAGVGDLGGASNEILPGGSGIIAPDGTWVAGPVAGKEEIVYGEIDLDRCIEERLLLDAVGHYNRPDVFQLTIDDRPRPQVRWRSGAGPGGDPPGASTEDAAD